MIDRININNSEAQPLLGFDGDRYYEGEDLTVKFSDEINGSTYSGNPWKWIQARIKAGNYIGIHVKDYIPLKTTNSVSLKMEVAGIDTYRNFADTAVGHHIDFISRELWPTLHPANPVDYNNGVSTQEHPWLASDLYHWLNSLSGSVPNAKTLAPEMKEVDYTKDGVYYFLPDNLKSVIAEKKLYLEKRYSASGLLTESNAGAWASIGKLWLPNEFEVYGSGVWANTPYATLSAVQYPIFAHNIYNRVKLRSGGRNSWWLLSPRADYTTYWTNVGSGGRAYATTASYTWVGAPVCFRIA